MLNIFFIDLFISVENESLKGLCWRDPDTIKVTDAPSWAAALAGGDSRVRAGYQLHRLASLSRLEG